uniref:Gonadoliberin n=1 Tax=Prolemur simus TaxID=1328070 RepID=A0A8C9A707_PROSS
MSLPLCGLGQPYGAGASGLLLALLLLLGRPEPSKAQHWSHGWYPERKRASSSPLRPPWRAGYSLGSLLKMGSGHCSRSQTARSLPSDALTSPEDRVPQESRTMAQWFPPQEAAPGINTAGKWGQRPPPFKTSHWFQWPRWLRAGGCDGENETPLGCPLPQHPSCLCAPTHTAGCHLLAFLFPRILDNL